ncbi:hypothetical protein EV360DRAFT_66403 [Lentinula raphanica]|nr:hypothetical protein EV360DRAFT_66403 [Lentinula raphanica]
MFFKIFSPMVALITNLKDLLSAHHLHPQIPTIEQSCVMEMTPSSEMPTYKAHWSPMARNFNPAQITNFYIVYRLRVQSWNATYNWAFQIISFEDWYASVKGYEGEEHNFELWYWTSWLEQQGLDVKFFLSPLVIPPGVLVPVETHPGPYYCCYTECHRLVPFSSKQARDRSCLKRYYSPYSLRRHQRIVHRMP